MTEDPTAKAFALITATVDKDLMKDYPTRQPATPEAVSATMFKTQQEIEMTDDKLTADRVIRDGFTEDLGPDELVAVDAHGRVIARADRATIEKDHPDASHFGVADFAGQPKADPEPEKPEEDKVENVEKNDAKVEAKADELAAAKAEVAKMDGDGDGKVGGRKRKPAKK